MSTTATQLIDVLAERRSTRVFDAAASIDESALHNALEAARWAPSAVNSQPWRMIVARRGSEAFEKIAGTLAGFNTAWASNAAAFVVFIVEGERDGVVLPWADYDTGQAAAHFTVQAHSEGLATHQMGGFDRAALAAAFELPSTLRPITVMAVGPFGDVTQASAEVRERETAPRERRAIEESVLINA